MVQASPTLNFRVTELETDVKAHSEWINGNGKKGAKSRLDSLEDIVERIECRLDKLISAVWVLAASIFTTGAGWILFKVIPDVIAKNGTP